MGHDLPLKFLKGIGPKRAEALHADGISTFTDLLYYLPRTYVSHLKATTLASLGISLKRNESLYQEEFDFRKGYYSEVTVLARVISHKEIPFARNKQLLILELADGSSGRAYIRFWSYVDFYKKQYPLGTYISVSGTPEIDTYGKVSFDHPDIERLDDDDEKEYNSGSILPIYPIKEHMRKSGFSTRLIRKIMSNLLDQELDSVIENLSPDIIRANSLPELKIAIKNAHFPESMEACDAAIRRIKFNEIFYFELMLANRKVGVSNKYNGLSIKSQSTLARTLYENLPFELTADQKKAIREIMGDLSAGKPMNRLLQGDVGSGKTIVSLLTMLAVIENGYQVAIMAPTEILAEQHYLSINKFTDGLGIKVIQLVGRQNKRYRREISEQIASGEANIIVGTHAMFESNLDYNNLGYLIIDEQHRFGVGQRAELIEKAKSSLLPETIPHILVMSATPIPRTLTMTIYGDLEVSIIKEMPKNRLPIITKIAFDNQIEQVFEFVRKEIEKGRQAYIVYPLVEKSEKMNYKSAIEHYEKLAETEFKGYRCGLLHGQLFGYEKDEVMSDFQKGKYQILISTTVIEVGIDVPNATVMVIEDAERFGLSQLHQLRGRVGRGSEQSYCILVTKDKMVFELKRRDIKDEEKKAAIVRMKTMEKTNDGFEISEIDLRLRGPGDILGTKQSGMPEFRFLDLIADSEIISAAKKSAFDLIASDPSLSNFKNRVIRVNYQKYMKKQNYFDIA
jgi:ATP-dependent DNA helicase RecG